MPGYRGKLAGKSGATGLRYAYDGAVRFQLDASPFSGGWTTTALASTANFGPPFYDDTTLGEVCVTAGSGGAAQVVMTYSLDGVIRENLTDSPGVVAVFQKLHLRYYRTDGASLISVKLHETPKAGGGYPTQLDIWSQATEFGVAGPGPWTQYDDPADLGYPLDVEANTYHLSLVYSNTLMGDCRIGVILLDFTKIAAE